MYNIYGVMNITGYAGKSYSIDDLRRKATEYSYGENILTRKNFEGVYNNTSKENLNNEV